MVQKRQRRQQISLYVEGTRKVEQERNDLQPCSLVKSEERCPSGAPKILQSRTVASTFEAVTL